MTNVIHVLKLLVNANDAQAILEINADSEDNDVYNVKLNGIDIFSGDIVNLLDLCKAILAAWDKEY